MPDVPPLQMELVTAAGPALRLRSMSALEEVSRLFEFQIIALSTDQNVAADKLLGTNVAVSVEVADGKKRWFHGIVAAFGIEGVDGRFFSYRITARPWAWLLTRSADVHIFQEMSTPAILKEIFGKYTSTFVDELTGSYAPRSYCVQYRETDFNFVSRLMEEEGIFYYWRHAEDKHELVLADASGTHKTVSGFTEVLYLEDDRALAEVQAINQWHMRHEIQTGKVTLSDYDFEKPKASLKSATVATSRSHGEAAHEAYDYPGLYSAKSDGDARAQIRLDEAASRFARFTGQGNTPGLVTGTRFKLQGHPRDDQNAEYVVLQTQIDMQQAGYESGRDTDTLFLCRFVAKSMAEPFRPARTTRKPTVAGPQTALVVGSGDAGDIETDKYGRIKVQFHWDRVGEKNAQSSCWLRLATSWAGHGWGMITLPRIGQEVVVAFLEGDPDQPLVVGSVYNAEQMPPYALPANKTVSGLRSRSKQGGASEYNELRFEDKAGNEYVLMQAQKDRFEIVKNDARSLIKNEEHRVVEKDRFEAVEGESHLTVKKEVRQKYEDKYHLQVVDDMLLDTQAQHSLKAAKDITAESGTAYSIKAGTDLHVKAGKNVGVDGGMNVHIKGGMNVVIEGGMQLTIKAGAGSVVLGPDGVSITGPMVKVNSGGSPGSGSGASPVAPTKPQDPKEAVGPDDPIG